MNIIVIHRESLTSLLVFTTMPVEEEFMVIKDRICKKKWSLEKIYDLVKDIKMVDPEEAITLEDASKIQRVLRREGQLTSNKVQDFPYVHNSLWSNLATSVMELMLRKINKLDIFMGHHLTDTPCPSSKDQELLILDLPNKQVSLNGVTYRICHGRLIKKK